MGDLRLWPAGGRRAAGAGVEVVAGEKDGSKAIARTVDGGNTLGGRAMWKLEQEQGPETEQDGGMSMNRTGCLQQGHWSSKDSGREASLVE